MRLLLTEQNYSIESNGGVHGVIVTATSLELFLRAHYPEFRLSRVKGSFAPL